MEDPTQAFKLIKAGRLIDGRGGAPIEEGAVLVQGSKINAVGSARDVLPPEGAPVETYDYPGKTILPGLIDCHTHHNGFGDGRPGEEGVVGDGEVPGPERRRGERTDPRGHEVGRGDGVEVEETARRAQGHRLDGRRRDEQQGLRDVRDAGEVERHGLAGERQADGGQLE